MSRITDSARMASCALLFSGICKAEAGNVVWAHHNKLAGGKAKGKKLARADHIGFPACYWCHMVLDGQAKRPATLTLDAIERAVVQALRESEERLRGLGLWPSDESLATKPVTVQRIQKKIVALEDRQKDKSREPVRAGRGFPSRKTANNATNGSTRSTSKQIVSGPINKENAPSRFPKGRKLVSANRLQSRPFQSK